MATSTLDSMSARYVDDDMKAAADKIPALIISADSHVDEPMDLWDEMPADLREEFPTRPVHAPGTRPAGGMDPKIRIEHMDLDGVSAEILYPTYGLRLFAIPHKAQKMAFRIYNDWIADYCKTSPKRLYAIPALCVYDIDDAIAEMQRCYDMGLKGGLVWQVPDPALPLTSDHYEKLWAAAGELGYPINFHILTGHNYNRAVRTGIEKPRASVNIKTADAVTSVYDILWSGVFERYPKFKMQLVESEIGWLPFHIQQWDYYYLRFSKEGPNHEDFPISRLPSDIFNDHVYATFMDDQVGCQTLKFWGDRNCMWSSDYPHPNMTWPNSRAFLGRQIGDLDPAKQRRVLSENVIELYKLDL
jgi:predicted TIM-barrel fold metal-dependent hydrolase